MAGKHSPTSLRNYLSIHETVMQRFRREGFVEADDLTLAPLGSGAIKMEGQIRCEGGLVFRYDNVHGYSGHPDASHRHSFDWRSGESAEVTWTGDTWPTLGEVLAEMQQWYWSHRDELG